MTERDDPKVSETDTPLEMTSDSDQGNDQSALTLWEEFRFLILHEKGWWMVPVLIGLIFIVLAVALSPSTTVPFIYRLF